MYPNEMYLVVLNILGRLGKVEPLNALRIVQRYDDGKVIIEGLFPLSFNSHNSQYDRITVALKLSPGSQSPSNPFELPQSKSNDETVVAHYRGEVNHYYRRGKWEEYLQSIFQKIEGDTKDFMAQNGQPVNDEELFK